MKGWTSDVNAPRRQIVPRTRLIYSLAMPQVRDLLIAARIILTEKLGPPVELVDELSRPPAS